MPFSYPSETKLKETVDSMGSSQAKKMLSSCLLSLRNMKPFFVKKSLNGLDLAKEIKVLAVNPIEEEENEKPSIPKSKPEYRPREPREVALTTTPRISLHHRTEEGTINHILRTHRQ